MGEVVKLPIISAILKAKNPSNQPAALELDANGRVKVTTSESFAPTVSATPPATPSVGDHWYNTAANQNLLYAWNGSEWLSANEFLIPFGEDSMDGQQAGFAGITGGGVGTQIQFPRDVKLTALTAQIRAGNNAKQFNLLINGVSVQTVTLPGADHVTVFPNLDVDVGEEFWISGNPAGANVQDVTFCCWWRWRV